MSRSDNWIGLNQEAEQFLDQNCTKRTELSILIVGDAPETIRTSEMQKRELRYAETYETVPGAYDNNFQLRKFALKNGKEVFEVVQTEIWDSGPNFFTCLKIDGKIVPGTEWSQKEMEDWL